MNVNLVLIHCVLTADEVDELITACGHEIVSELARDVPARHVASYALAVEHGRELVRVAVEDGWTVIADESGRLPEARAVWQRASETRKVSSLVMMADGEVVAFAWHGRDGGTRAVAVSEGEVHDAGQPLAIERAFGPAGPTSGDLLLIAQSVGVDLGRLNEQARYRLLTCTGEGAQARAVG